MRFVSQQLMRKIFICHMMAVLASCGFHLRGAVELPEHLLPLFVSVNGNANLSKELSRLLSANDIKLVEKKSDAVSVLLVEKINKKRRVLSIDGQGRAREYELTFQLSYSFKYKGDVLIEKQIQLTRDLLFDPLSVLAVDHETMALYKDMISDSTRLILQQLKASAENKK